MAKQFKLDDGDDIVPLFDQLVNKFENNKITEECFKKNFLPFFSGQESLSDVNTHSNFYNNWINVAGTPLNEVDVIDNNGNTLFTIPPLLDTNIVKTLVKPNKTFSAIFDEYSIRKNSITGNSAAILQRDIDNKLEESIDPKTVYSESEKKWNDIFNRYGIKNNSDHSDKNKDDPDTEELIYD